MIEDQSANHALSDKHKDEDNNSSNQSSCSSPLPTISASNVDVQVVDDLDEHSSSSDIVIEGEIVNQTETLSSTSELGDLSKNHKESDPGNNLVSGTYLCDKCDSTFDAQHTLKDHLDSCHTIPMDPLIQNSTESGNTVSQYQSASEISEKRMIKCPICSYEVTDQEEIIRHMTHSHTYP